MGKRTRGNYKHGASRTRTYRIWTCMIYRCTNPNVTSYPKYGGRGISVCERWLNSFQNFLDDMGFAPDDKSLDRIDNDGDYSPGNCRWATAKEQANNTRTNRVVEWQGKEYTVTQLAEILGVSRRRICHRLSTGWTVEEAVQPPRKMGRAVKAVSHG